MPAYKSANGKWYCKFYSKDWQGNRKQILKRGFATKREAQSYEHEYKTKNTAIPSMTLQMLSDEFLGGYKASHRNNSYLIAEANLRLHILPTLGEIMLDSLNLLKIRKWQVKMTKTDLKESTLHSIQTTLKKVLRYGIKYYGLSAKILNLDALGKRTSRMTFLELDEWNKLDYYIVDEHDNALFNLLFWSGIRIGEAMGLSEDDIDFEKNEISIRHQWDTKLKKIMPLKTAKSERKIVLPQFVIDLIKEYFGNYHTLPDYPFAIKNVRTIQKDLQDYCRIADITGISIHSLRHSHATLLIRNNVPIPAISKRLGHSNPATTLRVYSHVYKEADSEIAKMLEIVSKQYQ